MITYGTTGNGQVQHDLLGAVEVVVGGGGLLALVELRFGEDLDPGHRRPAQAAEEEEREQCRRCRRRRVGEPDRHVLNQRRERGGDMVDRGCGVDGFDGVDERKKRKSVDFSSARMK